MFDFKICTLYTINAPNFSSSIICVAYMCVYLAFRKKLYEPMDQHVIIETNMRPDRFMFDFKSYACASSDLYYIRHEHIFLFGLSDVLPNRFVDTALIALSGKTVYTHLLYSFCVVAQCQKFVLDFVMKLLRCAMDSTY